MPLKQKPLPGLRNITDAGDEYAAERLAELDAYVGPQTLVGQRRASRFAGGVEFTPTTLAPAHLSAATPGSFLAEFQFEVTDAFKSAFQFDLTEDAARRTGQSAPILNQLRPDLIEVQASGACERVVDPDGHVTAIASGDSRIPLRVIDIKLTSQPGPGYFAEVVYYSVALAGWLKDHGLDSDFAVSADPAIWPGTHEASALKRASDEAANTGTQLTSAEALTALREDLEPAPATVFVSSLKRFFTETLPDVVAEDWDQLPYHVSSKCRGCDFLGDNPDTDPNMAGNNQKFCLQTADRTEHLSRIPFISRGASTLLRDSGAPTVNAVAAIPQTSPVYDKHHSLRSQRTVIGARANSLDPTNGGAGGLVPDAGTSGMIPKWSDLSIYVTADFDSSSAITLTLGVYAFWSEPGNFSNRKIWNKQVFTVDTRTTAREADVLKQWLNQISTIIKYVEDQDTKRGATPSKSSQIQVYMWDDLTYKHLCRVVGRHLQEILAQKNGVETLAWLFPPEEVLRNERLVATPVISIVSDAVKTLVSLPVPHHYSLLNTARQYHHSSTKPPYDEFKVPRLFEVDLSDQIPSERAHDIWKRGPNWTSRVADLERTVMRKLDALESITRRLRDDLRGTLRREAAHVAYVGAPQVESKMTNDELLLYAHARLNAAVDKQEVVRARAMPPHEREARFASMRLNRRLHGKDLAQAFASLGLTPDVTLDIYEINTNSTQAKFKDGDFTCALVPEDRTEILDWNVKTLVKKTGGTAANVGFDDYTSVTDVLKVELVKFDRDLRLAVLRLSRWGGRDAIRQALIQDGRIDLESNVSLERTASDYFTPKLKSTLQAIGKTPKAVNAVASATALGRTLNPRAKARVPVEDILWDAAAMSSATVTRNVTGAKSVLNQNGRELNPSQWSAFDEALTKRLSIIWGPPGTGKSRTVVNIVTGAAWDAEQAQRGLRVLVCANTYTAIDNVLGNIAKLCSQVVPSAKVCRPRSSARTDVLPAPVIDLVVESNNPDTVQLGLHQRLVTGPSDITVVGATTQQIHKLSLAMGSAAEPLFDLIVIDEAGQMDVANATLPLATLAEEGCVVVAGDPLQLPPIHAIEPPENADYLVGSIYTYLRDRHQVPQKELLVNYRSSDEIVALARDANYPPALSAHSPALRVDYVTPLPAGATAPSGWPATLAWDPVLADLLDKDEPVVCLTYSDGLSGQSNSFEAQIVAGLSWLLDGRLADGLTGEIDPAGNPVPPSSTAYSTADLFVTGVGVVTPHRAQQSEVVAAVARVLPTVSQTALRDAVDTVERFQGQERDVIIASYAVGDPDVIADEDEFLLMLNRFNVMVSRAKAKIIVLISDDVLRHLPNDLDTLRESSLLKGFADIRCKNQRTVWLPYFDENRQRQTRVVTVRTP